MAFTYTKTDWANGDFFDYVNYNRIIDNLDYLKNQFTAFTWDFNPTLNSKTANDYLEYSEHNDSSELAMRLNNSYIKRNDDFAFRSNAVAGHPVWDALELNSIEQACQDAYDKLQEGVTLYYHRHSTLAVCTHEELGYYTHGSLYHGFIEGVDVPSEWDYELYNYDCDGTLATWIRDDSFEIFNDTNSPKDWEMVISGNTTKTAENGTTIGAIGINPNTQSGSRNCFIEVGLRPTGLYLYRTGNLSGTHNQVFPCTVMDKEIKIVKTNQTIDFYVEGVLINTFTITRALNNMEVGDRAILHIGGWKGTGGTYYFDGHINYFKFKYTS